MVFVEFYTGNKNEVNKQIKIYQIFHFYHDIFVIFLSYFQNHKWTDIFGMQCTRKIYMYKFFKIYTEVYCS